MYEIVYSKEAAKALRKLPRNTSARIVASIDGLSADPFAAANVKKLVGREDTYRLRIGDWRAIYAVNDGTVTIIVLKIAPRGRAYP